MKIKIGNLLKRGMCKHSANNVCYGLSKEELKDLPDSTDEEKIKKSMDIAKFNQACYSSLPGNVSSKHRTVYTQMKFEDKLKKFLSKDEMIRWLELAIEHKLLPEDFDIKKSLQHEGYIVAAFDINKTKLMSLLYIYLSTVRYIKESPTFVRTVLTLVEDKKLDFFVAITAASYYCMERNIHHVVPISAGYPVPGPYKTAQYALHHAKALRIFLDAPEKITGSAATTIVDGSSWNMFITLSSVGIEEFKRKFSGLKKKEVVDYIYGDEKSVKGQI